MNTSSQPEASSSKSPLPSTSTDPSTKSSIDSITRATTLREPPAPDLLPTTRPTLSQFRQSEGATTRAEKLEALWEALPSLPELSEGPTATKRMKLPGQDTMAALSPERAERLKELYLEELVRECNDKRPLAKLWGGRDDWKPDTTKGIAWEDFRYVPHFPSRSSLQVDASYGIKNVNYGIHFKSLTRTEMADWMLLK